MLSQRAMTMKMFGGGKVVNAMRRGLFTSPWRRGGDHHDIGGVPGENLPFGIKNRWKLAVYFGMWFGSGFATPFLFLRHQLLKKS